MHRYYPTIVLVNVNTDLQHDEIHKVANALSTQVRSHFAPAWNITAAIRADGNTRPPTHGEIELRLVSMPSPEVEGALGYHGRKPSGTPVAYVFVDLCKQCKIPWSSCASHEVLELLADPYTRQCVQMSDGSIWDMEVCDRVESDSYEIDGVVVSNFNFPSCFEPPQERHGVQYDYMDLSTKPNQVRPGGYAQRFDSSEGWKQVGMMRPYREAIKAASLSRGHKRQQTWLRNAVALAGEARSK